MLLCLVVCLTLLAEMITAMVSPVQDSFIVCLFFKHCLHLPYLALHSHIMQCTTPHTLSTRASPSSGASDRRAPGAVPAREGGRVGGEEGGGAKAGAATNHHRARETKTAEGTCIQTAGLPPQGAKSSFRRPRVLSV